MAKMFQKLRRKVYRIKQKEIKDKPIHAIYPAAQDTTNLRVFSFEDLSLMTQSFSDHNVLGRYEFATVFKGKMADHHMNVTIKLLKGGTSEATAWRLKNEIHFLVNPKVNYSYLPNILGYCCGNNESYAIVYNLRSDCILKNIVSEERLSWADRVLIGFKIALLLQHLHDQPCFSVDNISDDHVILDEARNPILYEFGMLHRMGDPSDISSVTSMNIYSFGNLLISLLRVDEEERKIMESIEGITVDGDTWSCYKKRCFGTIFDSDRSRFMMNPKCFLSHPYFYKNDAHKLSRLAIRCISNCVDERPCLNEIVGEFNRLFYISVNVSASLFVNCNVVQELKFCDIKNITHGFETLIGETQFGHLYRGSYRGTKVTVKVFRDTPVVCRRLLDINLKDKIYRLKDEISLLRDKRLSSFPCLPNLIAFCCEEDGVAVVYNFQTECQLSSFIADDKANWASRIDVIYQAARLLQCMHNYDPHFIVGNISSRHFLLDKDMRMVIADFGLLTGGFLGSKKVHKYRMFEGAIGYIDASAQLIGAWYRRNDVYAFGILLVELLHKCRLPHSTAMLDTLLRHWREQDGPIPTDAIINNSLKSDQFYHDDDACDLVTIALRSINYTLERWNINEIINQLDGLMLFRPSKHMYQALQKLSLTSHAQPLGSSSE